jgi:hypothetical protein
LIYYQNKSSTPYQPNVCLVRKCCSPQIVHLSTARGINASRLSFFKISYAPFLHVLDFMLTLNPLRNIASASTRGYSCLFFQGQSLSIRVSSVNREAHTCRSPHKKQHLILSLTNAPTFQHSTQLPNITRKTLGRVYFPISKRSKLCLYIFIGTLERYGPIGE